MTFSMDKGNEFVVEELRFVDGDDVSLVGNGQFELFYVGHGLRLELAPGV